MIIGNFGFQSAGGGGSLPSNLNVGIFTQIRDSLTVGNTTTETTLLGNGLGTLTVPKDTFVVGDSFHLKISGNINCQNNAPLTIRLHSNGLDIGTTGLLSLSQCTNRFWELRAYFVVRRTGVAGRAQLSTNGNFNYISDIGSQRFEGVDFVNLNNTTFDTTIANTLDVVCQWGTASISNKIDSSQAILTKMF